MRGAVRVHPTQREPDLEAGDGSKGGGEAAEGEETEEEMSSISCRT